MHRSLLANSLFNTDFELNAFSNSILFTRDVIKKSETYKVAFSRYCVATVSSAVDLLHDMLILSDDIYFKIKRKGIEFKEYSVRWNCVRIILGEYGICDFNTTMDFNTITRDLVYIFHLYSL